MALSNKEMQGYAFFGAAAAVASGWILKFISSTVSNIPGVNLDLQSISISTTGVGSVVNTGLSTFAKKALGVVNIPFTGAEWMWLAIGGALFVLAGAWVVDMFDLGKMVGAKTKKGMVTTILVVAGIITGWILSMQVNIPALSAIIVMVVDAFILSMILVPLDEATFKLLP